MLSLGTLRSFIAVAETGGIRPAARRLGLSPAAVTDHVSQIERELGTTLLLRRPQGLHLLPSGATLLPFARTMLETSARAREAVTSNGIAFAASSNTGIYMLLPLLAAFERETGLRVDLWVGSNPEIRARLLSGLSVCAVMEWWTPETGFEARPWRKEPLVLITAPDHPWVRREQINLEDLAAETVLGGEPGSGTGRILRAGLGEIVERLSLRTGFNSTEAVKQGVRAGLGVSLVLASAVREEIAAGMLAAPRLEDLSLSKTLWIVMLADTPAEAPAALLAGRLKTAG
jgi:DNA-binding transcriptional LysR family regulator